MDENTHESFVGSDIMVTECEDFTNIDLKLYNQTMCWCKATGHSMKPEINNNDIVVLKRIEDPSILLLGEIYAIVPSNNMRIIRRLGPSKIDGNYTMVPTNRSPEYGIQELPKSMISAIFQVVGCMKSF